MDTVLVTGGAGFIGSHVVDLLIERGYDTIIIDSLEPQVHGTSRKAPSYLNPRAKLRLLDIRNRNKVSRIVRSVDAILHLAAAVGVGQSMYEIDRYVSYNTLATASLLDILVNEKNRVRKLVVASSMSIYGEGSYQCPKCQEARYPDIRRDEDLRSRRWNPLCSECGTQLEPTPTKEEKPLRPTSIYAMSKRHQEEMSLLIGKTYDIPTVALRYFNVYGPRQTLSNPYTGVCALFASSLLRGKQPHVFEDGGQLRDFVYVKDVAEATVRALESNKAAGSAINIGSGETTTIAGLARSLAKTMGSNIEPKVSEEFRKGDVRHCFAYVSKAREILGFEAKVRLDDGFKELVAWATQEKWGETDAFERALRKLRTKGLASHAA